MKSWVLLLAALSLHASDLTGKWSGAPFYLILKQDGNTVTGTAGPSQKEMYPIQDALLDGSHLTFKVARFAFDLHVNGDEIRGAMQTDGQAMPVFVRRVVEGAAESPAVFDAASVKPALPDEKRSSMRVTAGRLTLTNVTLKSILTRAYDLADYQIAGPDWIDSERFEIVATMPAETPMQRVQEMLRTLLTERFNMAVHREPREMNVYGLVVGKKGIRMKEVAWGPGQRNNSSGKFIGRSIDMPGLADWLSHVADRPVIDMTGLKAHYDIDLAWTPEKSATDPEARTIYEAIEEQLGLRLEQRKAPVEVLVIDRAEKTPIAN
ncbi:MAG TPA: TIGR03435 family protein [Candidatus Limnocylindrales bacterium]|nr:TIGR03435 family protein [Candidatus Limnocylindrales bacterium]